MKTKITIEITIPHSIQDKEGLTEVIDKVLDLLPKEIHTCLKID